MGFFDKKDYHRRGERSTGIFDALNFQRRLFYDEDELFDWKIVGYVAAAAFL
jgi:hypothetical protein